MSILRLSIELEIDTTAKSTRVIDQHLMDGMPTTQVASPVARVGPHGLCAYPGCGHPTAKETGKYCGRACFGKSRRNPQFIERHTPGRQVIIDAVSGVVTPALPPPRVIREEIVSTAAAPNYSTFSFPS